jgi:GGDEF domain-containing protein
LHEVAVSSHLKDFPITIVSTDTTALREISWTLSSLGYQATTSSDWSDHAAWQRTNHPSLLLLDARDESEIRKLLSSPRSTPYSYRVAFYDSHSLVNADKLMELGADDLIRYPLVIGELISCLKRGRRRLEFEKRFSIATTFDLQTGIANRQGFLRQLERKLRDTRGRNEGCVLVMGIDFLDTIRPQYGQFAVEEANTLLAKLLHQELASEDSRGILQEGVYAALLQGQSVNQGIAFAENLGRIFSESSYTLNSKGLRLTLSGVVFDWPWGENAAEAIKRGLVALRNVRGFGGNQILEASEVEEAYMHWQQNLPMHNNVDAQHIMEALPLVLPISAANSTPNSWGIHAFSSQQPFPPCVPVIDESGSLLGVIEAETFRDCGSDAFAAIDEHLDPNPEVIVSDARLTAIATAMQAANKGYLLVVENNKPVGYITAETLAEAMSEPTEQSDDEEFLPGELGMKSLVVAQA